MTTPGEIIDLGKLFQRTFGSTAYGALPKNVSDPPSTNSDYVITMPQGADYYGQLSTPKGSLIAEMYNGVQVWLPVKLFVGTVFFTYLPYCVVKVDGKKNIIRTPLSERIGTVKEQYNIDDYKISIKGFLIGTSIGAAGFPEDQINNLKLLYEAQTAVTIDNALTNIFLTNSQLGFFEQRRVVITSLDFPEVQGGRKNVRPFAMEMESDSVFTLELA